MHPNAQTLVKFYTAFADLDAETLAGDRQILYEAATAAIEELGAHGVHGLDGLQIELLLARLEEARALDWP